METVRKGKTKTAIASVFIGLLLLAPFSGARAGWPTSNILEIPGVGLDNVLEMVRQQVWHAILAKVQQEAIKKIRETMAGLVGGGQGGQSFIINDYQDFIYGSSQKYAQAELEGFFQTISSGAAPGEQTMYRSIEKALKAEISPAPMMSKLGDLTGTANPYANIFDGGNFDAFEELNFGGSHPMDIYMEGKSRMIAAAEMAQDVQRTKATANQGLDPQNGVPGSVVAQVMAAAEKAPIDMIANAVSPAQIVANVVTSMITSFMENGYDSVSSPASNQSGSVGSALEGGMGSIQDMIYKGNNNGFKVEYLD